MHRPLALVAALALAACSPSASGPSADGAASASAVASQVAEAAGTITIVEGMAVDGPGLTIPEALNSGEADPLLVNGILLQDAEGTIWLCQSLSDSSPRACAGAFLAVEDFPEGVGDLDPANADVTGLQEEDGVVWLEDHQLYGTVSPSN
ncbi:MAG TPA: hypothetical protein VGO32_08100 [Candidatus Limnocylindria bacterium]|nr:hypothetical protein [Candidatus Limnocylindria bacterium]